MMPGAHACACVCVHECVRVDMYAHASKQTYTVSLVGVVQGLRRLLQRLGQS